MTPRQRPRPTPALIVALLAGAASALYLLGVALRHLLSGQPPAAPVTPPAESAALPPLPAAARETPAALPTQGAAWRRLLRTGAGSGAFVLAQAFMLAYRVPTGGVPGVQPDALITTIAPLLLYTGGLWLVFPALLRPLRAQIGQTLAVGREVWLAIGLLTVFLLALLLQTPLPQTPLPAQQLLLATGSTGGIYTDGDYGVLFALLVSLLGGTLGGMQLLSLLFALAAVPVIFLLGVSFGGVLIGLVAAGFAASSLWTLALASSGAPYSALLLLGALFVLALWQAAQSGRWQIWLAAGTALALGWLLSPLMRYAALLLPLLLLIRLWEWWRSRNRETRGTLLAAGQGVLLAAGVTGAVLLPFVLLTPPAPRLVPQFASGNSAIQPPLTYQQEHGISPLFATLDGTAQSLLLTTLTGDPSPLHGVVNRPALPPVVAGLFALGLFAGVVRLAGAGHGTDLLLAGALLALLLASGAQITPPAEYPHLGRAGLALGVIYLLAAQGAALLATVLQSALGGQARRVLALLFVLALALNAVDALDHTRNVFLPTYTQSIEAYQQLFDVEP